MSATQKKKAPNAPQRSRKRKFLFALISISLGLLVGLLFCEGIFRILEYRENSHNSYQGTGGVWFADGRWGWKPSQGEFRQTTSEYNINGNINSLFMNDYPYDAEADKMRTRVLALGDSHTYAVGVSYDRTWPKEIEAKLNAQFGANRFRVYNGGVVGFNMHQYLLRLMDQGPVTRPDYVVLGLSYATDLYDLLPPDKGGWIYGGDKARDYFDFDPSGHLVERHWMATGNSGGQPTTRAARVRTTLEYFATFRYLRRSNLALFIGSHLWINGQSLWPNMDVLLEKETSERNQYQWRLFEALLLRIKQESDRQGAKLIVVGIPYLPQVYDDLWQLSFGKDPKYSRTAAIERVSAFCKQHDITYVDTLDDFRAKTKELGRWLHFRKDGHPTAEGQELIANTILKAGAITPVAH